MAETRRLVFRIEDQTPPETSKNIRAIRRDLEKLDKALVNFEKHLPDQAALSAFARSLNSIRQQATLAGKGLESTTTGLKGLNREAKNTQKIQDRVKGLGEESQRTSGKVRETTDSFKKLVGTEAAIQKLKQALAPGQSTDRLIKSLVELRNTSKDLPTLAARLQNSFNLDDRDAIALAKSVARIGTSGSDAVKTARQIQRAFKLDDDSVDDLTQSVKKLDRATKKAAKGAKGFNSILAGLSGGAAFAAIDKITDAFRGIGNGIEGLVRGANKEFGSFDAALVEFSQKSGVAREDLGALGQEAKDLAAITSQTPATVAELSAALLALGTPVDQVQDSLSGVVKLADVINEDPVLTGKVLQTGVNIFGEFGETTDTIADKISKLINTTAAGSTGGVQEFFQLYQQAGPVAVEAGINFDELATAFATLRDAGVSARVGATGLRNTILNLAAPSDKARAILGELGVEVFEVGANGEETFVGLEEAVRRFGQSIEGLSEEEQIFAAERIFGKGNIAPVFALLNQLDGRFQETAQQVSNSAGEVDQALEVINQGARRQAELLSGVWASALTELGEAISPVGGAYLGFIRDILETSTAASSGLDELSAAGERLATALQENPQLVQQLSSALAQIGDLIVSTVAGGLDYLSNQINNLSENDLRSFTEGLVQTAQSGLQVAGAIGELLLAFGGLGANVGGAAVDAFNTLAPAITAILNHLTDTLRLLTPLTENTELLSFAMQVLAVRMAALKGIALAGSLKALAVQMGASATAAGGMSAAVGTLGTTAAAAAGPLLALAAAVAATKFIKHTRDLKVANDAIESYMEGTDAAANAAFKFANDIANIDRAIEASGGKVTDEQKRKLEGYKRIAEEQIGALRQQLQEIQSFEPQNQEQAGSQQALISQLETSIKALEGQIGKAESRLAGAAGGAGESTGKAFSEGLDEGLEEGSDAGDTESALVEEAESVIDGITAKYQDLATESNTLTQNLVADALAQGKSAEEVAAIEDGALTKRLALARQKLGELRAVNQDTLSPEDQEALQNEILQTEQEVADARVAVERNVQEAREEAAEQEKERREEAAEAAKEAAEQAKQAALDALDAELARAQEVSDIRVGLLEQQSEAIAQEQALFDQQTSLATTLSNLERERLETKLAQAEATGNETEAERIRQQLAEQGRAAIAAEFEAKQVNLNLSQRQAEIEAQRAVVLAEIAVTEARINVQKAQTNGASQAEIDNLNKIVSLQEQSLNSARAAESTTAEIGDLKQQELDAQRAIAIEEQTQSELDAKVESQGKLTQEAEKQAEQAQKQADLAEKIAEAEERRAQQLVSALSTQEKSTEESLKQLQTIRDNFREAQRAGLFGEVSGEFEAAARRLEGLLKGGAGTAELINFAQSTDSQVAQQLLSGVGRGDVLQLIEADQEFKSPLVEGGEQAGSSVKQGMIEGGEQAATLIAESVAGAIGGASVATAQSVPAARRKGGAIEAGSTYDVGEGGAELVRFASGREILLGTGGPQRIRAGESGHVFTASQTKNLLQARYKSGNLGGGTLGGVSMYAGLGGNQEVLRKLDTLIKVAQRNGAPKLSPVYNFPSSQDPYGAAAEASFATLRQMVKGAGL